MYLLQFSEEPDLSFMKTKQEQIAFLYGIDDHWGPLSVFEEVTAVYIIAYHEKLLASWSMHTHWSQPCNLMLDPTGWTVEEHEWPPRYCWFVVGLNLG